MLCLERFVGWNRIEWLCVFEVWLVFDFGCFFDFYWFEFVDDFVEFVVEFVDEFLGVFGGDCVLVGGFDEVFFFENVEGIVNFVVWVVCFVGYFYDVDWFIFDNYF